MATPHVFEVGDEEGLLLVIHGGAGKRTRESTPEENAEVDAALQAALAAGYARLEAGEPAEEAVIAAIHVMEDAPCFNAGRGAALTLEGKAEMDSCLMLGSGACGAACGLSTARHPIDVARAVMERTPHVLFAEPSAQQLDEWGIEQVENSYFITEKRQKSLEEFKARMAHNAESAQSEPRHGTIGAVARDAQGRIAAGTSTGGITGQQPGRIGDSPICGAGTYANQDSVAVSCTGTGEKFIQEVSAYQIHARVHFAGQSPAEAASIMLEAVEERGGDGGVIVLPAHGRGVMAFNEGAQMNRGWICASGCESFE